MADAVVSGLVKEVVGRLASLAIQELGLLWGSKDDILSLKDDFEQIEAVLEDTLEEKHVKNKSIELWLKRLRSASLEVENVLDEISTEILLQRLHKQRVKYRVRAFFSINHNNIISRVRIAHKVKDIREKVDAIAMAYKRFDLNPNPSRAISHVGHISVVAGEMPDRETSSYVLSSVIFGRNEEIKMVTENICNKDIGKYDNDGAIRVYGIWGMGGIGKTTLAQLVYNHDKVKQCFELRCWVYVSQNFQVKEIIKGIITSIDKRECTLPTLDLLQETVQTKLSGKKFLIVLDDVWIEDGEQNKWDQLRGTLSCGVEGSIVVMTTRSSTTSKMFAKVPELQHNLGCLSKADSWSLFKKFAFAERREAGDVDISEVEPIGREIVEKCKGLPLAIKTLGSLMWSKTRRADWELVKDNTIWNLQENNVLPALELSYDNLQPYMKKCFVYCCLFPKGHEMEKNTVIQLWVANNFIPPREQIDLYVLGEEIFNCLVWRSFFEVVTKNKFKMHDLMHDMAQNVMGCDCLVIDHVGTKVEVPDEVLHLSSSCRDFLFSSQDLRKLRSLRSILMWEEDIKEPCISQILNHVYLRVLHLPGLGALPKSLYKLKHLRYLNLSHSTIEVLPESIIYLQNLQVMILCNSFYLRKLPDGLRYMKNLKYLEIEGSYQLVSLKENMFPSLEELRIQWCRKLVSLPCNLPKLKLLNIRDCDELVSLQGNMFTSLEELHIFKCGNLVSLPCNLSKLKLLEIALCDELVSVKENMFPSLEELCIRGCGKLVSLPCNLPKLKLLRIWDCHELVSLQGNMFTSLEEVRITSCKNFVSLPRNLSKLKRLEIFLCDELVSIKENMFPSLEELRIWRCWKLVSLPCNLPKLKVLTIRDCDGLVSVPDEIQSNLDRLEITDCKHLNSRREIKPEY